MNSSHSERDLTSAPSQQQRRKCLICQMNYTIKDSRKFIKLLTVLLGQVVVVVVMGVGCSSFGEEVASILLVCNFLFLEERWQGRHTIYFLDQWSIWQCCWTFSLAESHKVSPGWEAIITSVQTFLFCYDIDRNPQLYILDFNYSRS